MHQWFQTFSFGIVSITTGIHSTQIQNHLMIECVHLILSFHRSDENWSGSGGSGRVTALSDEWLLVLWEEGKLSVKMLGWAGLGWWPGWPISPCLACPQCPHSLSRYSHSGEHQPLTTHWSADSWSVATQHLDISTCLLILSRETYLLVLIREIYLLSSHIQNRKIDRFSGVSTCQILLCRSA